MAWLQRRRSITCKDAGLYNHIRTIESPMDAWVTIDGRRLLNFCANNYLGLANHPRLRAGAQKGIDDYGVGPGAVRTIAGTTTLHVELERRLAAFKHAEACITFQSGFTANLATHSGAGRPGRRDLLRRAQPRQHHRRLPPEPRQGRPLRHNDVDDLRRKIAAAEDYEAAA